MDESEVMVLVFAVVAAFGGIAANHTGFLHNLHFRGNPAPGIVRLGVLLAMAWIGYVIWQYADPSVTGIYVVFYLVLGYAVIKTFGQTTPRMFGIRTRIDAGERRNVPVAIVIAAFTVATGLIFGGSLWGEADPVGDDEGGWWIPLGFFLLGWTCLLAAFGLFLRRERGFVHRLRRDRDSAAARAGAAFLISAAVALTDAVAGDFWGWRHGLLTFGFLAALLLAHEAFVSLAQPGQHGQRRSDARRALESASYLVLALLIWGLHRVFDTLIGPG